MSKKLLTTEHLENGQVEVPVEFLTGETGTIILKIPTFRERRTLLVSFARNPDPYLFVEACLRHALESRVEAFLSKLSPDALAAVENHAVACVCGEAYQKKMEEAGKQVLNALTVEQVEALNSSTGSESNSEPPGPPTQASTSSGSGPGAGSLSLSE